MRERRGRGLRMWPPKPSEVIRRGALQSCVTSEMSARNISRKSDAVCTASAGQDGGGWGGGRGAPTQLCVQPESPQPRALLSTHFLSGKACCRIATKSSREPGSPSMLTARGLSHMCGARTGGRGVQDWRFSWDLHLEALLRS